MKIMTKNENTMPNTPPRMRGSFRGHEVPNLLHGRDRGRLKVDVGEAD